jgi:NAD(P)-dependent dehydrogenase (short-subunit alcohol dehydrogenase family)
MPAVGDMTGKAALVTGAADGIGWGVAVKLAQAGADVCLVDADAAALEGRAEELRALGARACVQALDITEPDACEAVVAAAVEAFGRLDALCNVANAFFPSRATSMARADWDRTVATNLSAPFHLMQAAIPHLLKADGAVVNMSSCIAFMSLAYTAAYAATKAGLTHMTKALAMEYRDQPIRINAVAPGGMYAVSTGATKHIPADLDAKLFERFTPVRGYVEIDQVAEMIAFLASDASRGYHGACISIDNGVSLG